MDKNTKYRETHEENDDFTKRSNSDDRYARGGYNDDHEEVADEYADDEFGTDYEDLEDKWYEIESEYRDRYPDLTDDDVNVEPGRFRTTLDRIGRRTDKSPDEVRQDIENWQ